MKWCHYSVENDLLKKYISFYWINRHEEENVFDSHLPKLTPYGSTNLLFNFGSEYKYIGSNEEFIVKSHFKGPNLSFYNIEHNRKIDLLGVAFKPYGLFAFTDFPMNQLVNKVLNLEEVDKRFVSIENNLIGLTTDEERVEAFEAGLLKLMDNKKADIDDIISAIGIIYEKNGVVKAEDIAKEIQISDKTLQRKFKNVTGLTPKNYIRLVRFNYALRKVRQDKTDKPWLEVAVESGYFDQSHFINEFKEFTGNSPEKYLSKRDLLSDFYYSF